MCRSGYTPGAPVNSPGIGDEVMEDRALVKRPLWEETLVCENALQIHELKHTGKEPFVSNICGRAFTTKGNLKVHYMMHGANNNSVRWGRKLARENTVAVLCVEGKRVPEIFPKELLSPRGECEPHHVEPVYLMKTSKISVIQSTGIPTVLVSLGASFLVSKTTQLPSSKTHSRLWAGTWRHLLFLMICL
ncbi:Sal-like protein 4 [Microtus ochrogaster]|uniref:Sal-like protein 4 n=1 Tax=Microtus ochrogaster TaxID=79684 RepID=A0A8J6GEV2_MICOH|nr:Sal-like protein 4 [Microtus ochrogaster]